MPRSIKSIEISPEDITHIFGHILETIMVYEYPTPSIFSALTRLSIVSYLRGKGIDKDIELVAVDIFRQDGHPQLRLSHNAGNYMELGVESNDGNGIIKCAGSQLIIDDILKCNSDIDINGTYKVNGVQISASNLSDVYTKTEVDTNTYTQTQVDALLHSHAASASFAQTRLTSGLILG